MPLVANVLTDSAAARGIVRRTGSGRVKHLEARWLWLQDRVRSGDVRVGCVDTALNTSDLGTKLLVKKRFEELICMMPIRVGIGLLSVAKVEAKREDYDNEEPMYHAFIFCMYTSIIGCIFFFGAMCGMCLVRTWGATTSTTMT